MESASSLSRSSSSSSSSSRLNAGAPEFVPRSSSFNSNTTCSSSSSSSSTGTTNNTSATPRLVAVMAHNQNHNHHVLSPQFHHHQHHVSNHAFASYPKQEQQAVPTPDPTRNNNGVSLSEDARHKILNQVEYYFSDVNLATTDHLMKFISKDPEGYVPISVVASFKKIKSLVSSHSQLAAVLRKSSKLVVSDDGKKIRRQHPLTESDMEDLQSRIVLAENLPEDHSYQNLMKVFSAVGSVRTIRTCQPQNSNGGVSATPRSKFDNAISINKLHAFVEYETVEIAEKAVNELNDERNWRSGLKVRLMPKRMSKSMQARGRKFGGEDGNLEEDDLSTSEQLNDKHHLEEQSQTSDLILDDHNVEDNILTDKEGDARRGRGRGRGRNRGRGRGSHIGTPPCSNLIHSELASKQQPPGPRMPDGTRGFTMGRGKLLVCDIA